MPITPFHFGPGFLVKSLLLKRFSFRIFVLTNIITDLEPIYFVSTNQWPLHRFFHTYVGATITAAAVIVWGRPVCYWLTNHWNKIFKSFKLNNRRISTTALITSAFIGSYSHVVLDSIMHRDMLPLYPFAKSNFLLHSISYGQLHLLCVAFGVAGMLIYFKTRSLYDQN